MYQKKHKKLPVKFLIYTNLTGNFYSDYILKYFISSLSWSDTSLTLAAVSARILIVALSSCIEDVVCCVEAAFSSDIADRLDITSTTVTLELSHTSALPLITSVPCFETLMPLPTSLNLRKDLRKLVMALMFQSMEQMLLKAMPKYATVQELPLLM